MPHENILQPGKAVLVVIDIQEAFRSAIPDFALIVSRIVLAIRGFQALGLPVIVTEQYPKGLGNSAEEIQLVLADGTEVFEKTTFSSCGAAGFEEKLKSFGVTQVVLCGVEAHVCVNQTAHDLLAAGYQVHILCDCVASRFEYDRLNALAKMRRAGAIESSMEMALFELMGDARHEKFKEIQSFIR